MRAAKLDTICTEYCFERLFNRLLQMKPNRGIANGSGLCKQLGRNQILLCSGK